MASAAHNPTQTPTADFDEHVDAFSFRLALALRRILEIDSFDAPDEDEDEDNANLMPEEVAG
jgi:hypothetical protein